MRKSSVLLGSLAVGCALSAAFAWWQLRLEREHVAQLERQLEGSRPALNPLQESTVAAAVTVSTSADATDAPVLADSMTTANSAPAAPSTAATPAAPPPAAKRMTGRKENWQEKQRRALQDPRYREAWREQSRLTYALRRDNIMRLVGLTQREADAVIDLQIDRELAMIEDPESLGRARYQAGEDAHQASLRQLLGAEKSAQLQAYMESRGSRMQVDQFRNQLSGADMLRDDQVEPLIAAMHVENSQLRRDVEDYRLSQDWNAPTDEMRREFEERRAELTREAHARMHDAAAPILSRAQLEKFDAMLARDRDRRAAKQRMQGLQVEMGGPEPPTD